MNKSGCQWRMVPKDYGHWATGSGYFNRWGQQEVWAQVMEQLRRRERRRQSRHPEPSAACGDSQSIKIATQGEQVGFDGGKRVKGRKGHLVVDTLGIILAVSLTAANAADREGLLRVLTRYFASGIKRLRKVWVDGGYRGEILRESVGALKKTLKLIVEAVEREVKRFQVVKWRWVVKRSFAWLMHYRRHGRDYEVLTENSETMFQISMTHLLLKHLA